MPQGLTYLAICSTYQWKKCWNKTATLKANADAIDIIERNMRDVTAVYEKIKRESAKIGLQLQKNKNNANNIWRQSARCC